MKKYCAKYDPYLFLPRNLQVLNKSLSRNLHFQLLQDTSRTPFAQNRRKYAVFSHQKVAVFLQPDAHTILLYAIKRLLLAVLVILTKLRPPGFQDTENFSFIFSRTPKTKISPQDTKRTPFSQKLSKISICYVM